MRDIGEWERGGEDDGESGGRKLVVIDGDGDEHAKRGKDKLGGV